MTPSAATAPPPRAARGRAVDRPLVAFLLLAFGLAWAWSAALLVAGDAVAPGRAWPTHLPALLAPGLATVLVTARTEGRAGAGRLLRRLTAWRLPAAAWAAVLAPPAVGLVAAGTAALAGGDAPTWGALGRFSGTAPGVGWVVLAVLLNGVGEETGWRGWLLPRLRRRHGAVPATLLLTVAWAAWHAPFFALLTSYGDFGVVQLPGFVLGLAAGALVLTWLWERTGGSLLAVALWHAAYNLTVATDAGAGVVAAAVTTVVMVGALAVLPALRRRGPTAAQPPAGPVSIG